MKKRLQERFEEKVSYEALTGCWLWTGSLTPGGYAQIYSGGKTAAGNHRPVRASHIALKLFRGIDVGEMSALQRCDNPACVNPAHLFVGSQRDNIHDMLAKGRFKKPKTNSHCRNGHEFNEGNTRVVNGIRKCRACARACTAAYRERKAKVSA